MARFPWNGFTTGSVHASATEAANKPLRPKFIWEPVAEATHYELQIDDECPIASFSECAFPNAELDARIEAPTNERPVAFVPSDDLPASRVAPVGRRYYWRVRACAEQACFAWSRVRYLDVGRLANDYNCDGYSDVVVGAPGAGPVERSSEGHAFVYFGGTSGLRNTPLRSYTNPDSIQSGVFGSAVSSAGDVNGDGCSDLIIGAPFQDFAEGDEGAVFVFLGSPAGLPTTPDARLLNPVEGRSTFGRSISSAGDFNGDGYSDIVVGAAMQTNGAISEGGAHLFLGSDAGLNATPRISLDNPGNQDSAFMGASVAGIGDINGDGYGDIVIGATDQDGNEAISGSAFVYLGNPEVVLDAPTFATPSDAPSSSRFGSAASGGGDFNGDGFSDFVVGAPGYVVGNEQPGAAFLYFGARDNLDGQNYVPFVGEPKRVPGQLGTSVALRGDIDGDGLDDLVAGAPRRMTDGVTYVYLGTPSVEVREPSLSYPAPEDEGKERGRSVSNAGDIDGDGFYDIVSGSPGSNSIASRPGGWVDVYLGPPENQGAKDARLTNPGATEGDRFGSAVY